MAKGEASKGGLIFFKTLTFFKVKDTHKNVLRG